ncbi:family 10 glycosylhydrolase [Actinotalea sp. K2]|uniref:glycoside hydrolase family 10 protein n=1 Tax=Actinotalea sp. K2 TaxID=2939438 RepID=UPI002016CA62|nr:family 10 glycosylhydrolase [Actinotalea sp. K2]MCL3859629.1 family 10 glycosylhydrolase [Actinotalea sp. K2]
MGRGRGLVLGLVVLVGLVATGCGPGDEPSSGPGVDPGPTQPGPAPEPNLPEPTPTPTEQVPAPPSAESALTRAVWVHLFDDSLKTREAIRGVVADLVSAGATAVVAEVVRRHDAYYRSEVLPRTADPALEPGLDVLEALLEEGHAAGLEVHAWVPVAPTWHASYADLPAPDGWVTADHGVSAPEADRWVTRTVDGTWDEYLDPALPEVREHLAEVVGEIASRYAVDGIHLDYVRYASERHGYHPRAIALYQAQTGAIEVPEPQDPSWSQWRREQVDALLLAARDAIRAGERSPLLSAAVISWGEGPGGAGTASFADTRAYREALQDWEGWARSGLVDVLMPMNYFREAEPDQAAWLRTWLTYQVQLGGRTGTRIVPGVAGYLNSPTDALTQVRLAVQHGGAVAMYSYQGSTAEPGRALWGDLAVTGWGEVSAGVGAG